MTAAEALAELRGVIAALRSAPAPDGREIRWALWTAYEVAADGVDPVVELRIRHLRRRVGLLPVS
jgi:hypothetical protein